MMLQHFDVGQRSDAYRAAERSLLALQAQLVIEQTEKLAEDLESELAKFVAELKADRH